MKRQFSSNNRPCRLTRLVRCRWYASISLQPHDLGISLALDTAEIDRCVAPLEVYLVQPANGIGRVLFE